MQISWCHVLKEEYSRIVFPDSPWITNPEASKVGCYRTNWFLDRQFSPMYEVEMMLANNLKTYILATEPSQNNYHNILNKRPKVVIWFVLFYCISYYVLKIIMFDYRLYNNLIVIIIIIINILIIIIIIINIVIIIIIHIVTIYIIYVMLHILFVL